MKYYIVKDTGHNPYRNIAIEKYLFDHCKQDEFFLYLWVNDPCVVAGCNQNVLLEWDNTFLKDNHIFPVRRFTGGGCVYHDRGNLNYTFISSLAHKDIEKWLHIVLEPIRSFSVKAEFTGRNDLTIGNKKFGGTAWLEENDKILFHGTLMVDVDTKTMQKCLTPNIIKFEGKAIQSVKSRVSNLKQFNDTITIEALKDGILSTFSQHYASPVPFSLENTPPLEESIQHLFSKEWIYNRNSNCDLSLTYKIHTQCIQLDLKILENTIVALDIFTDSLDVTLAQKIKNHLLYTKYTDNDFEAILYDLLQ